MRLTVNCEDNLITIPKIISITNNLLANYQIREVAIIGLRTLSFELFLLLPPVTMRESSASTGQTTAHSTTHCPGGHLEEVSVGAAGNRSANSNPLMSNSEIDAQKEVVLQFLEKFIETVECQRVLNLLLLIEHLQQRHIIGHVERPTKKPSVLHPLKDPLSNAPAADDGHQFITDPTIAIAAHPCISNADQLCEMLLRQSLLTNHLIIHDWEGFLLADAFFRNNTQRILGSSKMFLTILEYLATVVRSLMFSTLMTITLFQWGL